MVILLCRIPEGVDLPKASNGIFGVSSKIKSLGSACPTRAKAHDGFVYSLYPSPNSVLCLSGRNSRVCAGKNGRGAAYNPSRKLTT